jgi:hypothetical protein
MDTYITHQCIFSHSVSKRERTGVQYRPYFDAVNSNIKKVQKDEKYSTPQEHFSSCQFEKLDHKSF